MTCTLQPVASSLTRDESFVARARKSNEIGARETKGNESWTQVLKSRHRFIRTYGYFRLGLKNGGTCHSANPRGALKARWGVILSCRRIAIVTSAKLHNQRQVVGAD